MKLLLILFFIFGCSHNLQKGHFRKVGKKRYLIQIQSNVPQMEMLFESVKKELCLRYHHGKSRVLSREYDKKMMVAQIECYQKGLPAPLKGKVQFLPLERGVGKFYIRCDKNLSCK